MFRLVVALAALVAVQEPPPRILLDQPLRAVEYQLDRLTVDELSRVERHDTDVKYRPVYLAMLTRQGTANAIREEALSAIVKLDRSTPAAVLLEALGRVKAEDDGLADRLAAMLMAQPAETLAAGRALFAKTIDESTSAFVRRGAYAGLMAADRSPDAAWQHAVSRGQTADAFAGLIAARPDAATFRLLAKEATGGSESMRAAAIRALDQLPADAWPPAAEIDPLAAALVAFVASAGPDGRSASPAADALQLAEKLSAALPEASRFAVRRDLRALGVRIVRIETLPEQMSFDVKWFAVEAGKPLQIVVANKDGMPHNLIIGAPNAVERIGAAAMSLGMPSDPAVKPFVPDSPLVIQATPLIREGETARLSFTAPAAPGEYVFLCSYPGHWVRMYGVMLVVSDLDAWEARPTVPTDPLTGKPFPR